MDHGNLNKSFTCFGKFFIVFAKSTTTTEPSEGPFHDPTTWQNVKALDVVAALDDLQYPAARLLHPLDQLSAVAAIRPNEFQSRKIAFCFFQNLLGAIAVLNVGRVNDYPFYIRRRRSDTDFCRWTPSPGMAIPGL